MILSLNCLLISIASLFICVNKYPSLSFKVFHHKFIIQTFYLMPLLSAIVLIVFNKVSSESLQSLLDFSLTINPVKILILFMSISFISLCLDKAGFFSMCASKVLAKSKGSNLKFFILIYVIISILTIFTSNDIVVLTFTPFICYYTSAKKINPLPYLFIEFIAANSWSMMLEIGNPTNIYLALNANISFIDYFSKMVLPTILSCLTSFALVLLIFKKSIFSNQQGQIQEIKYSANKFLIAVGLVHLIVCIIGLVLFNDYMYLVCLFCALSLSLFMIVYDLKNKDKTTISTIKKLPYSMIPFIISMYIIVCSLNESHITSYLTNALNNLSTNSFTTSITYGYASLLSCNILNNIPMSVLFSSIINSSSSLNVVAIYATIVGSNLGALLTPIGALAGIMWLNILKNQNIKINFLSFIRYCGIICLLSAFVAFVTLAIIL